MGESDIPQSMEDIERKKKKEEKAKAKELKKQKAAQKAEAAKVQAQQPSNASKKSEKKNLKKDMEEENMEDYLDPETPLGEKKQLARLMAKQYSPAAVEKSWYAWWEKSGFFCRRCT